MMDKKDMCALGDNSLEKVSGGTAAPGKTMVCIANATLYSANPAGNNFRSEVKDAGTVSAGTPVKIYESGTQYCKVICNGKIGWIETSLLSE